MTDQALISWGRTVSRRRPGVPSLWLFTDTRRLPDPRPAARRLPKGIAGIVFRHDDHPDRVAIGRDLARICRARRLALVVSGDVRLAAALGAGVHIRGGRWPGPLRRPGMVTSSAHHRTDLIRARRNRATLAFLSPVFPTASHPGEPTLGAARWTRLARLVPLVVPLAIPLAIPWAAPLAIAGLGGLDGRNIKRLGYCRAVGAIGALS